MTLAEEFDLVAPAVSWQKSNSVFYMVLNSVFCCR